ncbi:type I secretion outer membrane protein, TolC [Phenylobacterium zucineum HLK1]|uniref:Type I secretion outer membrane protein, TolC n=1 Tax=Phenylobacterium zucineum (strain HLK1) TaxID=450851 RepID=B4R986_PHEZH|nr:TolC family outer membrane protein [Phenylobacterium zucineum]ACG77756.1 type I secretion outer membrane protein, TolC [Phenylobacterium zucineum HLK1]
MSKSPRGRLLAAVFSVGLAAAFAGPAAAETLADAIALAYETNPTLQAQRATQRALDESFVQARTGWRPTLNLNGSVRYLEDRSPRAIINPAQRTTIEEGNSASVGLTFNQPLWTGGRVAAAVSAAQAEVLAGRENLRRIEAQILATVIQAYADVRRDQEALRIRQENVRVLTRQLEESQARFDVGEVTRTDVAQSEARLAQAQALFSESEAQLAISRANYAQVVGQNPGELAPEPSLAHMLPTDPDQAYTVAEENNPQLRAQQFAEQASRARIAGARAERMPNVSAQATMAFGGPARPQPPNDPFERGLFNRESTATVNVTVPLFSGGLVSSRVRQAVERNNSDRLTTEAVRRSVLQNITSFWSQLIAARANIASSEQQVRAATIAAEGTRQEQQVGLRTTIDVLNAEQELRQAQLNQVFARRDEYVSAAGVLSTMGRLEARNLVPTAPQYDPAKNFRKLRVTWGWVPWEEPIGIVDRVLTPWPAPTPDPKPVEAAIPPGLTPPPANAAAPR